MPPPLASRAMQRPRTAAISPESPPLVTLASGPDGAASLRAVGAVAGKSRGGRLGPEEKLCWAHTSEEVRAVPAPGSAVKWRGHRRGHTPRMALLLLPPQGITDPGSLLSGTSVSSSLPAHTRPPRPTPAQSLGGGGVPAACSAVAARRLSQVPPPIPLPWTQLPCLQAEPT